MRQNTPWEVTDQNGEKKIIWEDRSLATALFAFTKDKNGYWRVLSIKRGRGCPDYIGDWCVPCGYLDYNETLRNAAYRECKEETGVMLSENRFKFLTIVDEPSENNQTVTALFYTIVENGFDYSFTNRYNEPNEVDEIAWIRLDLLDNFSWAFSHKEVIKRIYINVINIPWWKKVLIKLTQKYL